MYRCTKFPTPWNAKNSCRPPYRFVKPHAHTQHREIPTLSDYSCPVQRRGSGCDKVRHRHGQLCRDRPSLPSSLSDFHRGKMVAFSCRSSVPEVAGMLGQAVIGLKAVVNAGRPNQPCRLQESKLFRGQNLGPSQPPPGVVFHAEFSASVPRMKRCTAVAWK